MRNLTFSLWTRIDGRRSLQTSRGTCGAEKGLADLTIRNYKADIQPLYEYMRLNDIGQICARLTASICAATWRG